MRRLSWVLLALMVGIASRGAGAAPPQEGPRGAAAATLPMDRLEISGHPPCEGLIESEDRCWIYLIQIRRPQGKPMYLVIRPIDRASVEKVVRLEPAERDALRRQIEEFRNRAAIEAGRMQAVRLETAQAEGSRCQRYRGRWFTLDSTADETTTRRVIVRTEQIFAAYRQILPPQTAPRQPPRLLIFGSMASYQAFLGRLGIRIQNRACFLEEKNLVVAGSELDRLVESMAKTNAQNDQLGRQLGELEKRLSGRLREMADSLRRDRVPAGEIQRLVGIERRKFEEQSTRLRGEIAQAERGAAKAFHQSTRQMFARLAHESFHAYLENYVYPHNRWDVPRWLNEGLAVMFEGGMLEGETLRVDAPNFTALRALRADLAGGQPLGLEKLITAPPNDFLPLDQAAVPAANRYYAYSWALAYDLTFRQRLLGSPALDRYVRQGQGEAAGAVGRFERLLGMPLGQFEAQWHDGMLSLRSRP